MQGWGWGEPGRWSRSQVLSPPRSAVPKATAMPEVIETTVCRRDELSRAAMDGACVRPLRRPATLHPQAPSDNRSSLWPVWRIILVCDVRARWNVVSRPLSSGWGCKIGRLDARIVLEAVRGSTSDAWIRQHPLPGPLVRCFGLATHRTQTGTSNGRRAWKHGNDDGAGDVFCLARSSGCSRAAIVSPLPFCLIPHPAASCMA